MFKVGDKIIVINGNYAITKVGAIGIIRNHRPDELIRVDFRNCPICISQVDIDQIDYLVFNIDINHIKHIIDNKELLEEIL